jgi:hypothetical protein
MPDDESGAAVIAHNVVSLFRDADASSEQTSQFIFGQHVRILEYDMGGEFARVEGPDRYTGWLRAKYLASPQDVSDSPRTTIASLIADVFSSPSIDSQMVTKLTVTAPVTLARHSAEREFTPIVMPRGETAYTHRVHLSSTYSASVSLDGIGKLPGEEMLGMDRAKLLSHLMSIVIASSLRFIGTPYLWGGVTSFGIDCSGLTQVCYKIVGLQLLRDASMQFADRRFGPVEEDRPMSEGVFEAGDLIFFHGRTAQDADRIVHVGLAIGDGSFIHAAGGGQGVIVSPCDDPRWVPIYTGARRLSPDADLSIEAA